MTPDEPKRTALRFVGVDNCVPAPDEETTSLLVNDDTLVDLGWNAAFHLRRLGIDPLDLTHVFLTHCHQDHFLGMAPLLFYRAMAGWRRGQAPTLTVVGPRNEIEIVVDRALAYLQADRYCDAVPPVETVALRPGASFETPRLRVATAQTVHPTIGLAYRFEDHETGATLAVTGDTAYHPPLGRFAAGVDVLVHEAACGPGRRDPLAAGGHSGAEDAALIACEANPARLALVHCPAETRADALASAQRVFERARAPRAGELWEIPFADSHRA